MKLIQGEQIKVEVSGGISGKNAGISEDKMDKLYDLLASPYSNPIGSIVREYTSNCFDSHVEAKVNDAVVVGIFADNGNHYAVFEDVGVGISPDRMENVFINYLSSTKETSNDYHGFFGIGSKSGLSYQNEFLIRTRFDGKEYLYLFHKGERVPRIELLYEIPTTERNGTQIKIEIKAGDLGTWKEEFRRQLCYFDNVYYAGLVEHYNNDYKIYEGKSFVYRPDYKYDSELHIVLGKVAYPISWKDVDFGALNMDWVFYFPLAVKFAIGELPVTLTRENIKYTSDAKKLIVERIEEVRQELLKMHEEQSKETDDYIEYVKNRQKKVLRFDSYELDMSRLGVKPNLTFSKLKWLNLEQVELFAEFEVVNSLNKSGKVARDFVSDVLYNITSNKILYRISTPYNTKKNKYIASLVDTWGKNTNIRFVRRREIGFRELCIILKLRDRSLFSGTKTSIARERVKEYRQVALETLVAHSQKYETVTIDPQWLEDQKTKSSNDRAAKRKADKVILLHHMQRTDSKYTDDVEVKLSKLERYKGILVIGTKDDVDALGRVNTILSYLNYRDSKSDWRFDMKKVIIAHVSQYNLKLIKESCNVVSPSEFYGKFPKLIGRIATVITLKRRITLFTDIFAGVYSLIPKINNKVWESYWSLDKYCRSFPSIKEHMRLQDEILYYATEHNLFNTQLIDEVNKLVLYADGLPLIKALRASYIGSGELEEILPDIIRYMKSKGKRVNNEFYKLK